MTIFILVAIGFYGIYHQLNRFNATAKARIIATAIGNEEIELVRNAPYASVGTIGGIPNGVFPQTKTVNRSNIDFTVNLVIKSIDDPFDGTITSQPQDTSPADYKLTQVTVSCPSCRKPIVLTSHVAPKNLESTGNNGALFIQVIDADGQPLPGASVHIVNTTTAPTIDITDISDSAGRYTIVDAPPANQSYQIMISKTGYSTVQTYLPNDPPNPNPTAPHLTVVAGQVTSVTYAIDKVSTLQVNTQSLACSQLGNIGFTLTGAKLIGTNPNIIKFNQSTTTDGNGIKTFNGLEWDSYGLTIDDPGYDLAGTIPIMPFNLAPDSTLNTSLILSPMSTHSLLVSVKDGSTQLPVSGATVSLALGVYDESRLTGQGSMTQTNWLGGGGQENFSDDPTKFFSQTNIDYASIPGQIMTDFVVSIPTPTPTPTPTATPTPAPPLPAILESSTFDTGGPNNFIALSWQPASQSQNYGTAKFQFATNNDNATWNFVGPDGTVDTYYTASNTAINTIHNGNRYFRYKVFLEQGPAGSPVIADVSTSYTSSCTPPGQAFFTDTPAGEATVTVTMPGYQTANQIVNILGETRQEILLQAQ